jgi:hypothetical protein
VKLIAFALFVIYNYLQEHSWHQLSCDAGIQDAFHEKHRPNGVAHCPQCQGHHCDQGKPEYDPKDELAKQILFKREKGEKLLSTTLADN